MTSFSNTISSLNPASDHTGNYEITSAQHKAVLLKEDSESLRCHELLNCSHAFPPKRITELLINVQHYSLI